MAFAKLVVFDRRLTGAILPGQSGRLFGERELATKTEEAYRQGVDATRAVADQQMVEFRADMQQLSEGVLKDLAGLESTMTDQLREALPALALDIAKRLFAGFEPPQEIVEKLCLEALDQLYPERENLEVSVAPQDAEFLERINPDWKGRFPGLRIRADASLSSGDCMVRSRFGLTDARQKTKLAALERSLTGA
jgi:flagellar assembly protein FliH